MQEQLPDDYFLDTSTEMLEYLESQGNANLKELNDSLNKIREKAIKILDILIVGIGAGLLLIFQSSRGLALNLALISFIATWCLISIYIGKNFISTIERYSISNSPENLYNQSFKKNDDEGKLLILRKYELHNASLAIKKLLSLNTSLCKKLDRVVMLISISPAIFLTVYLFTSFWVRYRESVGG